MKNMTSRPLLTYFFFQNKKTHFSVFKGSLMGTLVLLKRNKNKKTNNKFFETKVTKKTEATRKNRTGGWQTNPAIAAHSDLMCFNDGTIFKS